MRLAHSESLDDRTARARIRDAAITRFAANGIKRTTVRMIAAQAGVSPGLVIHHFGTKDGLRHACDEHVASFIGARKHDAMAQGSAFDPLAAMRAASATVPLAGYLARSLADGSPAVAALIDRMVDDAARYTAEGVRSGTLLPSQYPYERAAVMTIWSLGALVLHEHLERLIGVDITLDPADLEDPRQYAAYLGPVLELMTEGMLTEKVAAAMRDAFVGAPSQEEGEQQ